MTRRFTFVVCVMTLTLGLGGIACNGGGSAKMTEFQHVSSGNLDIVLLTPTDALHHGKDTFNIEFRSKTDAQLVDVGDVRAAASMPMAGSAPMFGGVDVTRTSVPGRYAAASDFGMAGTWRVTLEWNGPGGRGSVTFSGSIQ